MLSLSPATRIFIALEPVDLRQSFNGLQARVQSVLEQDPLSGHVFLFTNRHRNRLKLLLFDGSGLWICAKRLEKDISRACGNGTVQMPLQKTFWSVRFGVLVDQFGKPWAINCEQAPSVESRERKGSRKTPPDSRRHRQRLRINHQHPCCQKDDLRFGTLLARPVYIALVCLIQALLKEVHRRVGAAANLATVVGLLDSGVVDVLNMAKSASAVFSQTLSGLSRSTSD